MKQLPLPGFEDFVTSIEEPEKEPLRRLLQSYLSTISAMRTYPGLLPRSGKVGDKVVELIASVELLLQEELKQ